MVGKFDRFLGKDSKTPSLKTLLPTLQSSTRAPANTTSSSRPRARDIEQLIGSKKGRFCIALDATGSMASLIDMAKANIGKIMARLADETKTDIEIELLVYRDYDVGGELLVERSGFSKDPARLSRWLQGKSAIGGGGNDGEAIEAVLAKILKEEDIDAVLVAGDEPPNSRASLDNAGRNKDKTAIDLASLFVERHLPIHTFVIGDDSLAREGLAQIANATGGKCGRLDGSDAMIDMAVMAMLSAIKGKDAVKQYMKDRQMTSSAKEYGALLLEGPKK